MARHRPKPLEIVLVIAATALVVVGIILLTTEVRSLPTFLGGHAFNPKHPKLTYTRKYTKRGIAAFILAGLALLGAYYASATRRRHRSH